MSNRRAAGAPRLPGPTGRWLFADPFASLWLRPWFDRAALHLIARWYLPLSRAWATALAAGTDRAEFWRALPGDGPPPAGLRVPLALVAERRAAYAEAARRWEAAFFGDGPADDEALVRSETNRRTAAEMLMLARGAFLPMAARRRLPQVKWDIRTPAEAELQHAHRLTDPAAAFPPPAPPAFEPSRRVAGPAGPQFWLRFASPVAAAGTAWARVFEPIATADPPTIVFLHGIGIEMEFWPDGRDPLPALAAEGVRVVRPEGPWHGRRRRHGCYGGEPALALGPVGFLDLFQAWISEVAALIAWARRTSRGPVALGGISLGALTGQLAAVAARHWPAEMRPDALLLVATTGRIAETVVASSLARVIGLPARLAAVGWSESALARWRPLAEPMAPPAVAARRVVMVLASADDVTPFLGGVALADQWEVPTANRFIWKRGHFSTGLGIGADAGPIRRLLQVMG